MGWKSGWHSEACRSALLALQGSKPKWNIKFKKTKIPTFSSWKTGRRESFLPAVYQVSIATIMPRTSPPLEVSTAPTPCPRAPGWRVGVSLAGPFCSAQCLSFSSWPGGLSRHCFLTTMAEQRGRNRKLPLPCPRLPPPGPRTFSASALSLGNRPLAKAGPGPVQLPRRAPRTARAVWMQEKGVRATDGAHTARVLLTQRQQ